MSLRVRTNGHKRYLLAWHDLPAKDQEEFEYLTDEGEQWQLRFVKFKGQYLDVMDTQPIFVGRRGPIYAMSVDKDHPFAAWDAIAADSYFSGTLFKITTDDRVIVGEYIS